MKIIPYILVLILILPDIIISAQNTQIAKSVETGLNAENSTPIAEGESKFLGNIYSSSQWPGFLNYWNQVTPENAGKWGSVEKSKGYFSWVQLDKAYNAAKNNGLPFKLHVLIWGNQQPSWIENLSQQEQREEIQKWFQALADRYPDIDLIEVVNEPLHDPPNQSGDGGGNYYNALGGAGETGWDWVIKAFRYARNIFPGVKLGINEYNIVNSTQNTDRYIEIIDLLKADTLIDFVGVQAHAFSLGASHSLIKSNLDKLAETELPLYVTELDIDGPTDLEQLGAYQRVFPTFWEHEAIKGITLWGFRPGMWRTSEKAYLIDTDGNERPALTWLREYVNGTYVALNDITILGEDGRNTIEEDKGTLQLSIAYSPENPTFQGVEWEVFQEDIATIDENGLLTAIANGDVDIQATSLDGSNKRDYFRVGISNQELVGLNQFKIQDRRLNIFPNPSENGVFTIKGIDKVKEIQLKGIDGKTLTTFQADQPDEVRFNTKLPAGIYIMQVNDGSYTYSRKVVIK